jgi:hypothetical protein
MVQIPILVVGIFDLLNTTSEVESIEEMLKSAANQKITLVPILMEKINEVYYRDKNLSRTFRGMEYTGVTDDRRAIRAFVGNVFEFLKPVLSGRSKIYILHSEDYEKEGKMLEVLITGQRLETQIIRIDNAKLIEV